MTNTKISVIKKFTDKSSINSDTGCFEWEGKNHRGYGQISLEGKTQFIHRLSYEHFNGPIINGNFVMHKCDNPRCWNPEHLTQGTHQDNMDDMVNKGRQGVRSGNNQNANKTSCKRGHEFTLENTTITTQGSRQCKKCRQLMDQRKAAIAKNI